MFTSRNNMKRVLTLTLVVLGTTLWAQQNPTIDNYLFNPVSISPAYAGQQNGQIQTLYDAQWVGLQGAPRTGALYYDYMSPNRFGFNVGIIDDQVGPMHNQSLGLSTAYHLQVAKNTYFSTGIRYTLAKTSLDFTDDFYVDKVDASIYNMQGPWIGNVDLSGTLYSENWFGGLTFKNMVQQEIYVNNFTARQAHIFGGYSFKMPQDGWSFNPSVLVNVTENAPLDLNMHAFFEYQGKVGAGLNMSPGDEVGMFFRAKLPSGWMMFYQYNYPLSDLVYVTQQSHVIGVGFDLVQDAKTIISPRYFL